MKLLDAMMTDHDRLALRFAGPLGPKSSSMAPDRRRTRPASLCQIARNRTVNPAAYEHEDRFFHYDQVGSVMTVTDADACGNTLEHWTKTGDSQEHAWGL